VSSAPVSLQLILFIDDRPSTRELAREVEQFLEQQTHPADLQIIDVKAQPQLAELFRVVFTPALIKITPAPRQTIAGKNLVSQLETCWQEWQNQAQNRAPGEQAELSETITYSAELIKLADQVFHLNQDKSQLEEQTYFQERVMAMLAHDLRGPLTAISLALETIEMSRDKISQEQMEQMLKHARHQTKLVNNLISDILEAGNLAIKPHRLSLNHLCDQVSEDFYITNRLESKQLTFRKDIPPDLPPVYADEERIRQVLINLLDNAIKYTPAHGKIDLTVMHRTSQKVEVSVTDTGLGVPPDLRQRIFEDRYRLDRDDQEGGYGIGLSLCRRIIRAHYGQIWVESDGATGSSFRFTLPVF
jgi:two-component system clock-associated histidine kinase SasA